LKHGVVPNLPGPSDIPGLLDVVASDATDPVTINIAAKRIVERNPHNPFFRVLADGPTAEVRSLIIERYPDGSTKPDNGHWIWEKGSADPTGTKEHSMGWDCAFVGALYNKMRVPRDFRDQPLDLFGKYMDPIEGSTKQAFEGLRTLELGLETKQKALDAANQALNDAERARFTQAHKRR